MDLIPRRKARQHPTWPLVNFAKWVVENYRLDMILYDADNDALVPNLSPRGDRAERSSRQSPEPVELSLVIPTYNERDNLVPLVRRISAALDGYAWEVIFVDDDSPDGTAEAARALYADDPRVRSIRRIGRRGLASACIEGMLASSAPLLAVMDADLQHDPALLPLMLRRLVSENADVAVASRYVDGGDLGAWSAGRTTGSRMATRLAHRLTGVTVRDPMSGYFVVKRHIIEQNAHAYSGLGFKVLLDILLTARDPLRVVEVPLRFGQRAHGSSKASSAVAWEYLLFLFEKATGGRIPVRFIAFCTIGGLGVAVHFLVLLLFLKLIGTHFIAGQIAATAVSIISNFTINNLLTYADCRLRGWRWIRGLASFGLICGFGALANVGVAAWLFAKHTSWPLAALAGIAASAVWNYGVSARYTWSGEK
jgi:dolichol-phosphate mannosyltransferase